MKSRVVIGLLIVVCVALGIVLSKKSKEARQQEIQATSKIEDLSVQRSRLENTLGEQESVNARLTNDVVVAKEQIKNLEGNLAKTQAEAQAALKAAQEAAQQRISKLQTELEQTQTQVVQARESNEALARKAEQEIAARDAKINALNSNNDELTGKINSLSTSIDGLNKQIAGTQQKLAAAEGDREFLIKELKRMQAEKAELEQRMKDLAFLRDQVQQLREELNIARRLDWIRKGIYGAGEIKKGATIMKESMSPPSPAPQQFELEVEVTRDGKTAPKTNAPPVAPAPPTAPK